MSIGGSLEIDASTGFFGQGGTDGGLAAVTIGNGGTVDIGGSLTVRADAYGQRARLSSLTTL